MAESVQELRISWKESDTKRDEGLTTPEDIKRYDDISYGPYGEWNLLDIYHKKDVTAPQPAIVNIHGGGWFYGTKEVYQYYCMNLAQRGFTVISFNYRLAPENKYPAPLEDINRAFAFIQEKADQYYIDMNNLFVVGDSAGAQLASQYLTILTNPEYAKYFGLNLPQVQVRAVALNCGIYDIRECRDYDLEDRLNDYVGKEAFAEEYRGVPVMETLNTLGHMTGDFPPAYVMSACNDFLMERAEPMYQHIKKLGVDCKMKIYGTKEQEDVAHVFHVNIKLKEATLCNDDECEFFRQHMA